MARVWYRRHTEETRREVKLWRSAFAAAQRVSKMGLSYDTARALGHHKAVKKRLLGPEYEAWMDTYTGAMMG